MTSNYVSIRRTLEDFLRPYPEDFQDFLTQVVGLSSRSGNSCLLLGLHCESTGVHLDLRERKGGLLDVRASGYAHDDRDLIEFARMHRAKIKEGKT